MMEVNYKLFVFYTNVPYVYNIYVPKDKSCLFHNKLCRYTHPWDIELRVGAFVSVVYMAMLDLE